MLYRNSISYRNWRKTVLERDNFTCQECGATEKLETHHIKPVSEYPELITDINNGLTLCKSCHRKIPRTRTKTTAKTIKNKDGTQIKQLRVCGWGTAIIIPKAWLDLLNWQAKDNVKLELDLVNKEIKIKEN